MILQILRKIIEWRKLHRLHQPIITIEINKSALLNNLSSMRSIAPKWVIAPVLKSNAYGHGLTLVASILENENLPFFCVDSYSEAQMIRDFGITKAITVLGYTPTNTVAKNKLPNISFVVASMEQLRGLLKQKASIHIKFDTGMHRQGILPNQLGEVLNLIGKTSLRIEGVMSHLADAETKNSTSVKQQILAWNELARRLQKSFPSIKYFHLANSAGFVYYDEIFGNVGRSGIALYGVNPGNLKLKLNPVLEMKSVISEIRTLEVHERIGYNGTFTTERKTKVATIPSGYFEGIDRRLSNKGVFKIGQKFAPLLGRISMNISSCDITDIKNADVGTSVVVISNKETEQNSVENIAKLCETVPHEIFAHIPVNLHRIVV